MKKIERIVGLCLVGILLILPIEHVSAKVVTLEKKAITLTTQKINTKNQLLNTSRNYNQINDNSMNLVDVQNDTFEDEDCVIKVSGKIYEDTKVDSTGYKRKDATYTWYVLSKTGSYQLIITLDVTFKRNGTYVYVSDKNYFYTVYNNHAFENISQSYTKKANKSRTKAHYTVKGTLRNKKNDKSKKYTFKITCTPSGKIGISP